MVAKAWIGAICFSLTGCSLAPGGAQAIHTADAAIDTAVTDVQHFNDKMADTIPKLNCAITIGAFARLAAGDVKTGLGLMCGLYHTAAPLLPKGGEIIETPAQETPTPQAVAPAR